MNRAPLFAVGAAIVAAVLYFFLYQPEGRQAAVGEVTVVLADAGVVPDAAPIARPKAAPDAQVADTPGEEVDAALGAPVEPPEPETGPFTISIGVHTIVMRERQHALTVGLELVTRDKVTRDEVRRRRRELVRMLFFLGSHRSGEAAAAADAKARFEADVLSRYRNVIKTGPLLRMNITEWALNPWSMPPKEETP